VSVILALGLGLTLFVALALTDRAISRELRSGIPDKAPAFFFLDVRNDELAAFIEAVKREPGVTEVGSAPMLRGRVVKVKGVAAEKVRASPESNWALRGDRGLTYSAVLPEGSVLTQGRWWPADYDGPPLVSLVDEIAIGIGAAIGDEITVNVLGRDVGEGRQSAPGGAASACSSWCFPCTGRRHHIHVPSVQGGDRGKLLNTIARAPSVTAVPSGCHRRRRRSPVKMLAAFAAPAR
jgi:hypothetical protein